ncbi:hypothetical protein [Streptomyces sp. enrichment culture]|uniref:hypothetical protein n=1 Tax=Streptomyces sp. enrichment culture TaxID=1795815 RepID=UPI003F560772
MNFHLYIDPVNGLIVAIGLLVGYLVYRRPLAGAGMQPQPHRDLPGGIGSALAAILILAFLFGRGDGRTSEPEVDDKRPAPVVTVHETQPGTRAVER